MIRIAVLTAVALLKTRFPILDIDNKTKRQKPLEISHEPGFPKNTQVAFFFVPLIIIFDFVLDKTAGCRCRHLE